MELLDLKKEIVKKELGITEDFGRIHCSIDFGNVNYWFDDDRQDHNDTQLQDNERLSIDLEKLKEFVELFSQETRFYYGHDGANAGSLGFLRASKAIFGQRRVITKPIQKVRHDITTIEAPSNTRVVRRDSRGTFVYIPKCNFDVEISVDAMRLLDTYDTFCLFSGDADFVRLLHFLKGKGKKTILIKGGRILHTLKDSASLIISAQDIKKHVTTIKQKPDQIGQAFADR